MDEIWKDIVDYEGKYAVSNLGRVKSLARVDSIGRKVNEKILSPRKDRDGYLRARLCKGGERKLHFIHRLVLQTFNPCDGELEVNHINEKKDDNRLENLEWTTHKENINHGTRTLRAAEKMTNGKKSIPIVQLTLDGKLVNVYKSSMAAAREGGYNQGNINNCLKGRLKTYKGYKWQYLSEYIHNIDPRIKKVILFDKEYGF